MSRFPIRPHDQRDVNTTGSLTIENPLRKGKVEKDCGYLQGPCGPNRNGYLTTVPTYHRIPAVTNRTRSREPVERMDRV